MAVLGEGCVDKQSNVVMLKTQGADEAEVEGCIVQLGKGQGSLMAPCDVTIDGLAGCTMTLVSGDGPVYLSGVHRHEHPLTDELERTQWATDDEGTMDDETAEEPSDEDDDEDEDEEDEEEEESPVKARNAKKGKSPGKGAKNQKKKADTEEEVDEEEDMDEEEEDEEEEEKPVKKAAKKTNAAGAVKGKKEKTVAKSKTPETKKGKKAK